MKHITFERFSDHLIKHLRSHHQVVVLNSSWGQMVDHIAVGHAGMNLSVATVHNGLMFEVGFYGSVEGMMAGELPVSFGVVRFDHHGPDDHHSAFGMPGLELTAQQEGLTCCMYTEYEYTIMLVALNSLAFKVRDAILHLEKRYAIDTDR